MDGPTWVRICRPTGLVKCVMASMFFFLVYLFILAGLLYLNYVSLIVRVKQHSHVHITADEIGTCCAILSGCGHGLVTVTCSVQAYISYHSNKVETAVLVLFFFLRNTIRDILIEVLVPSTIS
jgi:hypothetical protein